MVENPDVLSFCRGLGNGGRTFVYLDYFSWTCAVLFGILAYVWGIFFHFSRVRS
jgi:hypothetical protein